MGKTVKKILLMTIVAGGLFVFASSILAQTKDKFGIEDTATSAGLEKQVAGATSVEELIGSIVSVVLSLVGIIFFMLIFYSGFNWMTARGNEEKITKAKDTIGSAAIGLIVVLAAYAITNFVFTELANNSAGQNNTTPQSTACRYYCVDAAECASAGRTPVLSEVCSGTQICCNMSI